MNLVEGNNNAKFVACDAAKGEKDDLVGCQGVTEGGNRFFFQIQILHSVPVYKQDFLKFHLFPQGTYEYDLYLDPDTMVQIRPKDAAFVKNVQNRYIKYKSLLNIISA